MMSFMEDGLILAGMKPMAQLGDMHAASFKTDPKHLGFVLARYTFVAKMIAGANFALDVGCGDGTGARIVKPVVGTLIGIDREDQPDYPGVFHKWDIVNDVPGGGIQFEAVFALDFLEHIDPEIEIVVIDNMIRNLWKRGTCIIGMPSKESQPYASELSRKHHVNCKTEDGLRTTMHRHFVNVFMFGMNDATLHTGFGPMCHYRLALCTGKRE